MADDARPVDVLVIGGYPFVVDKKVGPPPAPGRDWRRADGVPVEDTGSA